MALTLKTAITATETTVDILGADAINDGDVFEIGSEYVAIQGDPGEPARQLGVAYFRRANFRRGVQGTAEAAHAAGAGMTQKLPAAGGTSDHTALTNLDTADQHPQSAITDLDTALAMAADGQITGPNGSTITFGADGTVAMQSGGAQIYVQPDGVIKLAGAVAGLVSVTADGSIEITGVLGLAFTLPAAGGLVITGLPTADPAFQAGEVWNNAGVLMLSEGV